MHVAFFRAVITCALQRIRRGRLGCLCQPAVFLAWKLDHVQYRICVATSVWGQLVAFSSISQAHGLLGCQDHFIARWKVISVHDAWTHSIV